MIALGKLLSRFRKQPSQAAAMTLPEAVATSLDGATILLRHGRGDEGNETEAIVQLAGLNGFIFSMEEAAKFISRIWPDLHDRQVSQGVQRLHLLVVGRLRAATNSIEKSRCWRDAY